MSLPLTPEPAGGQEAPASHTGGLEGSACIACEGLPNDGSCPCHCHTPQPEPARLSVGGPLLDLESFEDRAYQRGKEAGAVEMLERAAKAAELWGESAAEKKRSGFNAEEREFYAGQRHVMGNFAAFLRALPLSPAPAPLVGEKEK